MNENGIVRNRLKIESVIRNAESYLKINQREQSFSHFIWSFVQGNPIINHWHSLKELPVKTEISDRMSKSLKNEGFKFVGSTICYAFMQAVGMVNDHICDCFRYQQIIEIVRKR
jgi:DNA-3-methyladenine glycosylase I